MDAISVELCYHATGVEYLNSDDYFISQERKQRCIYYDALKDKKEEHEDKRIQHKNAQSVIQDFQKKKNENSYNDIDMQALLLSELKVLYKWKHGKLPKTRLNKPGLFLDWLTLKDTVEEGEEGA